MIRKHNLYFRAFIISCFRGEKFVGVCVGLWLIKIKK